MASVDSDAIITRVRELLLSGAGAVRTISSSRFLGGLYEDLSEGGQSIRALVKPIVEPSVQIIGRNPNNPPVNGTFVIYDISVKVTIVRHLNLIHKLSDSVRDDVMALASNDADVVAQALTWPGNMTQTSAAAPTGVVSGCLLYVGSDEPTIELANEANKIMSVHNFSGTVLCTTAIS